ncbi:MAG: DUF4070 domain-containing protein [Patescibacteria group bacterium]|nr:DUF4070 domain-containing protein [Patescibacteria group bacterium]
MKILFVYPKYPETFWSFKYAIKFINKKAAYPPLGLMTVASMLPKIWKKKLVDLNIRELKDEEIKWADYVFIGAMVVQKDSAKQIIARCKSFGKKIVAGGPLFTMEPEKFKDVDHLVLNEGEITIPRFLDDFKKRKLRHIYRTEKKPGLLKTPSPMWRLINKKHYATMSLQFSRGCPYNCEFCNITSLFGRIPRLKDTNQFLKELDSLYDYGWRGAVFIVDDNFIGNKLQLKMETLPALVKWMQEHKYPFNFLTEASVNMADDSELMTLMSRAGFTSVFLGIETPSKASLKNCNKYNNVNRNLLSCVKKIQNHGIEVTSGFIVGFDKDTPSIFQRQIDFIKQSGIAIAMVGILTAPQGTNLYKRLEKEGRLIKEKYFSGNNTDFSTNFVTKMDINKLVEGYKRIVTTIYSPEEYYQRVMKFFPELKRPKIKRSYGFDFQRILALFRSMFHLGLKEKGRRAYWKFFFKVLFKHPRYFPDAITYAIYGFHFRKIFNIQRS